jgi:hypothetical protein
MILLKLGFHYLKKIFVFNLQEFNFIENFKILIDFCFVNLKICFYFFFLKNIVLYEPNNLLNFYLVKLLIYFIFLSILHFLLLNQINHNLENHFY